MGSAHSRPTGDTGTRKYAFNDDNAEQGAVHEHGKSTTAIAPSGVKEGAKSDFREDAKIWQLYLEEAEKIANDKAHLWATGLDSLLIFAGLFAGVVSSFVVDIRTDLQPDREPHLLSDILDVLQNTAPPSASNIPNSAYWIHALWVFSLVITIFSAVLGVLAKAWLATYTPAKNQGTAKDACERYTLDKQAERWHVKEILKLPPLFIQTATLLFIAGLVLQALGDAPTTGRILLCLCLVGAVVYFFVTVRPLFAPSPPSSTPLSGTPQASVPKPGEKDLPEAKPTFDGCLAQILYHKLIVPQKPASIDAVLAEVALPGFKHKWIDYLCKNDTPKILHSRLRECVTSRTMSAAERGEAVTSCLLVLLSFTEAYERALAQEKIALGADVEYYKQALSKNSPFITKYGNLDETLREFSVGSTELSHGTDDRLGRLLFAVQANLLTIPPVSTRAILSSHGAPPDIDHGELSSLPWGVAFQETPPAHRMHVALAICRGVVQGKGNLKKVSSSILCLGLAKASLKPAEGVNWGSSLTGTEEERRRVRTLMLRCISSLYKVTGTHIVVSGWQEMALEAFRDMLPVKAPKRAEGTQDATIPNLLYSSLSQPESSVHVHVFKVLGHWITALASSTSTRRGFDKPKLDHMVSMAVRNSYSMQDGFLDLLRKYIEASEFESTRTEAVVSTLLSELNQHVDSPPRIGLIQFIVQLSKDNNGLLIRVLTTLIPLLNDLDDLSRCGLEPDRIRQASTAALKEMVLAHLAQSFRKSRRAFLASLIAILEAVSSPTRSEQRPLWTFLWDLPWDFLRDFLDHRDIPAAPCVFEEFVKTATEEALDITLTEGAQELLDLLCALEPSYIPSLINLIPPNLSARLPPKGLSLAANWVDLLTRVLPQILANREALELELEQVTISLRHIVASVQSAVDTHSSPTSARISEGATTTTTQRLDSIKEPGILKLLDDCDQGDRIRWIRLFSILSEFSPQDFPDAPKTLFKILWHFQRDHHVTQASIDGLLWLKMQAAITPKLRECVLSNSIRMTEARDGRIRAALPRLLTDPSVSAGPRLDKPTLGTLRNQNTDHTVVSSGGDEGEQFLARILFFLTRGAELQSSKDNAIELSLFDEGIKGDDPLLRESWLGVAASHIMDASSPRIDLILEKAIEDGDSLVRKAASGALYRLLNHPIIPRSPFASRLAGFFAKRIGNRKDHTSIASLLARLISNQSDSNILLEDSAPLPGLYGKAKFYPLAELDNPLPPGHDAWIRLVMFLGKNKFHKEISAIIEAAMSDKERFSVKDPVSAAFKTVDVWSEHLTDLPDLQSGPSAPEADDRLEAVNLLFSLLDDKNGYGLIGDLDSSQRFHRVVDIEVRDDDERSRERAQDLLTFLLLNGRLGDSPRIYWADWIKAHLESGKRDFQQRSIGILSTLTEVTSSWSESLNDTISPSVPALLRLTSLVPEKDRHIELCHLAEGILLDNFTAYAAGRITTLNEKVLSAIPSMISEISVSGKGRKLASSLIDTLRVSDSKSSEISRALIPHLRDQAALSRITTLELLSSLNRQYHDRLDLTELAIGEIVSLAFKDSVDEIRIAAVQLLSALAMPLEGPERTSVLKPTAQLATRIMSLLRSEIMRPSVIELLSVMALESSVRHTISLEIMAVALKREDDSLEGYTELLARLISDGRFGHEPSDKVMLLLASTIITRPNLAQYRFEMLTALWCRYGATVIAPYQVKTHTPEQGMADKPQPEIYLEPKDKATEQLVDWFEFAVFGKHATKHEVKKFLTRSAIWLPALTSESEEVKGHLRPIAEAKEHAEPAVEAKKKK